ncbi:MAG: hypothetical protein BWY09_02386 [Candidatus Hydrogenedentes bacterium ADurb.Bin179]|nr:MAG: hypothetical protein BWY09_02386 [Candidatus Hydrogenedentes bacterium ADurb.Bin179]
MAIGQHFRFFNGGDITAYKEILGGGEFLGSFCNPRCLKRKIRRFQDVINHTLQAHLTAIFRGKYFRYAKSLYLCYFRRNNHPAATAEHFDMTCALLQKQVHNEFKKFYMPALVTGHGNRLYVFLNGGMDNLRSRTVVSEVNHFCP